MYHYTLHPLQTVLGVLFLGVGNHMMYRLSKTKLVKIIRYINENFRYQSDGEFGELLTMERFERAMRILTWVWSVQVAIDSILMSNMATIGGARR